MRFYLLAAFTAVVMCAGGAFAYIRTHQAPPPPPPAPAPTTPTWPKHSIIGHSVEGRPIDEYTWGDGAIRLLFVGGMHGGYEWNSVVLAYRFMDYLGTDTKMLPVGISVTIVPDVNPDAVYNGIKKEGRFTEADVPKGDLSHARFNANGVDLNRNFDCHWSPKGTWRNKSVGTGGGPFSEPESQALRDLVLKIRPTSVVFWHSQANAVYASQCDDGILPVTLDSMEAYAKAGDYPAVKSFDAYPVTGDAEGWLASERIPAITVELSSHETIEWDKNIAGIKALFDHFGAKGRQ